VRALGLVPLVLLGAGVALIADAVVAGGATVAIVVIVPVLSGSSAEFLLGVALLVGAFFSLPFVLSTEPPEAPALPSTAPPPPSVTSGGPTAGGLVLLGPVPIFFGSWRNVSARTRLWIALVGAVVLALFLVGAFFAFR
jgi:uncharacterized membrane protein